MRTWCWLLAGVFVGAGMVVLAGAGMLAAIRADD